MEFLKKMTFVAFTVAMVAGDANAMITEHTNLRGRTYYMRGSTRTTKAAFERQEQQRLALANQQAVVQNLARQPGGQAGDVGNLDQVDEQELSDEQEVSSEESVSVEDMLEVVAPRAQGLKARVVNCVKNYAPYVKTYAPYAVAAIPTLLAGMQHHARNVVYEACHDTASPFYHDCYIYPESSLALWESSRNMYLGLAVVIVAGVALYKNGTSWFTWCKNKVKSVLPARAANTDALPAADEAPETD